MLMELERDISDRRVHLNRRLSERGERDFSDLLRRAVSSGDEVTLTNSLREGERLRIVEPRINPTDYAVRGVMVPLGAAKEIAEAAFNRYYIRALCVRAIQDDIPYLLILRAGPPRFVRKHNEALIGNKVDPTELLEHIRSRSGYESTGTFPATNAGISVRLP